VLPQTQIIQEKYCLFREELIRLIFREKIAREETTMTLTITEAAVAEIKKFIESENLSPEQVGLRVRVIPGGCSGFQYDLALDEAPESGDTVLEISGIRVFVDPLSQRYLNGVEIDYVRSVMGSGFTFRNPNARGTCGCGSSFTV
jgi:iron-sulfur cluster assembly protein